MNLFVKNKIFQSLFIIILFALNIAGCQEKDHFISLGGEWEYRKGFSEEWLRYPNSVLWEKATVPIIIEKLPGLENFSETKGAVTFKKIVPQKAIDLIKNNKTLSFYSDRVGDVVEFYFNDQIFGTVGSVNPYKNGNDMILVKVLPSNAYIASKQNYIYAVVHFFGNFASSGLKGSDIKLGISEKIFSSYYKNLIISFIFLSIYLLVGLYDFFPNGYCF